MFFSPKDQKDEKFFIFCRFRDFFAKTLDEFFIML